jgi:alpha-tubulin suppressor-like RCC1 family protein
MSRRYLAGFIQAGLFNPLAAPGAPTYTYDLWSWGRNSSGQLGLGNITNYSSPKQVGALTTWLNIAAGANFTIATKTNGTLWSWGTNVNGRLGLGNTTSYSSPKQVGALTTWLKIAAGYGHSLATKTDGTLWSWGRNTEGQLGLGNVAGVYSSPKQVGALTNWLNITAGYFHTLATKTDGTLWSWGNGASYGQLGLGNITDYSSPKQVGLLTTWLTIAAGGYHTLATKTDGTLWSWGQNTYGQLGLGNTTNYSSPKQVGALTTWATIAGGKLHSLTTKTDGTLWSWGINANGQLGLGNVTYYSSPKQVGALTTWSKVAASISVHTLAIKTNETLWAWGNNVNGQLGLGDATNRSSPVQVGVLTTWSKVTTGTYHTIALKY